MKVPERFKAENNPKTVFSQEFYQVFLSTLLKFQSTKDEAILAEFNSFARNYGAIFEPLGIGFLIKSNNCFTITQEHKSEWKKAYLCTIYSGDYWFVYAGNRNMDNTSVFVNSNFKIVEMRQNWSDFMLLQNLPKSESVQIEEKTEKLKQHSQDLVQAQNLTGSNASINILHPLVLFNGGLGILAGFAKVGKSTLMPCLLDEIVKIHPEIHILFYSLDEDIFYTLRRFKAYPNLSKHPNFKVIDYEEFFKKAEAKGNFNFELVAEEICTLPQEALKLVVIDSIGKISDFLILIEPKAKLTEKEKVFLKVRKVLKETRTTLLGIHHLTKVADSRLREMKSGEIDTEKIDFVNYFLSSVKGSTFLIENADYIAIVISNPSAPQKERLLSLVGRHLPQSITLCYESYYPTGYDFPVIRKKEFFTIHPDAEQILENQENLTFMMVLYEKNSAKLSEIVGEVCRRLNIPPDEQPKLLKRLWKRVCYGQHSFKKLGLIEQENKLLILTDFGKELLKLYLNQKGTMKWKTLVE